MANIKNAKAKLEKLNTVKEDIKQKLVDCHAQIDQFANMLAPWYAAKELLQRPLVINIWGMTGVGKTQMVREFVKGLGLSNVFTSVCIDTKNGMGNILSDFTRLIVNSDSSTTEIDGIIMLDEFQNLVTKGMFNNRAATDGKLWEILSSGKIHEEIDKTDIISMVAHIKASLNPSVSREKRCIAPWKDSVYSAIRYAKIFKIKKPLLEIMSMSEADMLSVAEATLKNFSNTVFELDFSKCVFIICGNLDGVFAMATESARVDIDADVIHESCKDITIFDVKRGLSEFLFPEQIARLGNNHIIFYSISKAGYRKIIVQALEQLKENTKKISNVDITFDPSVYKAIYRNGVFPTQGARPVFSTITSMLYTVIPQIIFNIETDENTKDMPTAITLSYDESDHTVNTDDGRKFFSIGPVDEAMLRMARDEDERRCTSVHESGHAIVYAELFNAVPAAIVSVIADSYVAAGYINTHQIRHTRVTMKNFITVAVAGMVAEEIVFGKDYRTVGCSSDLVTATTIAAKYIRRYAFSDGVKAVVDGGVDFYNNIGGTSDFINNMIKECITDATNILHNNIELLKAESEALFAKSKLEPEEFNAIAEDKGKKYQILKFNARIVPNFNTKYEAFKESNVKDVEELSAESVKALESFYQMVPPKEVKYEDFNPDTYNDLWSTAND